MTILHLLMCVFCGVVLTRMNYLPCHWEWWAIVIFVLESTFFGFHLGLRQEKKNEKETPNAE